MNCVEREQLFAYVARMLEGREETMVREHLEQCARCRTAAEELRRLDAVLDEWRPAEPSPWFDTRVRAAVAAMRAKKTRRPFFAWPWEKLWVPALALLVIIVAALAILRTRPSPQAPQPVAQKEQPMQPAATKSPEAQPEMLAQSETPSAAQPGTATPSVEDELTLYENLGILEDYELLANFDILSELPHGGQEVVN